MSDTKKAAEHRRARRRFALNARLEMFRARPSDTTRQEARILRQLERLDALQK